MWDIATKSEIANFAGHTETIKVSLWLDQNLFISGGGDSVLRVWDIRSRKEVKQAAAPGQVNSLEVSQDGKLLTMAAGKSATFLETTSLAVVKTFAFPMEVSTASLHPSATRFVIGGSADFWDHVCDFASGKEIGTA